jgi:hypothetical protein
MDGVGEGCSLSAEDPCWMRHCRVLARAVDP